MATCLGTNAVVVTRITVSILFLRSTLKGKHFPPWLTLNRKDLYTRGGGGGGGGGG